MLNLQLGGICHHNLLKESDLPLPFEDGIIKKIVEPIAKI